jgi:hypothetical protein
MISREPCHSETGHKMNYRFSCLNLYIAEKTKAMMAISIECTKRDIIYQVKIFLLQGVAESLAELAETLASFAIKLAELVETLAACYPRLTNF